MRTTNDGAAAGAMERMIAAAVAAGAGADVIAALRATAQATEPAPEVRTSRLDPRNVEVAFGAKPSDAVLAELKDARFRWAPTARVWYGRSEALPSRFAGLGTVAPVTVVVDVRPDDATEAAAKAAPTMPAGAVPILDLISKPKAPRPTPTARPIVARKDVGAGQWG